MQAAPCRSFRRPRRCIRAADAHPRGVHDSDPGESALDAHERKSSDPFVGVEVVFLHRRGFYQEALRDPEPDVAAHGGDGTSPDVECGERDTRDTRAPSRQGDRRTRDEDRREVVDTLTLRLADNIADASPFCSRQPRRSSGVHYNATTPTRQSDDSLGKQRPERPRHLVTSVISTRSAKPVERCTRSFEVRAEGLEPPHLAMPEPKSGASANSATPACGPFSRTLYPDATAT